MVETDRRDDVEPIVAPAHFLIVEAPYYGAIGSMLLAGAGATLAAGQATFDVVRVPGALEIPVAMNICLANAERQGRPYAGAIGLGCIIRGETYHFEIVANQSASGLMQVQLDTGIPVANGIVTTDTEAQAQVRAGPKGRACAEVAVEMANLLRAVQHFHP